VVAEARELKLTSDEHFTVDGTLIEAWASVKSFRPRAEQRSDRTPPDDPGNPSVNFHGERRRNATHQSTTDREARLAKKGAGKEAKLCYTESVLMENRNGIVIDLRVGQASGRAECEQGVCRHAAEDRGAAVAGGIRRAQSGANLDDDAGGETGPSRRRWKHRGPKPAKTLSREVVRPIRELESESQNGNPGLDA